MSGNGRWTHVQAMPGMGLVEQWILRVSDAPVCSLRRAGHGWEMSLLNLSGISAQTRRVVSSVTLEEAKAMAETGLRQMGWSWGEAPTSSAATTSE